MRLGVRWSGCLVLSMVMLASGCATTDRIQGSPEGGVLARFDGLALTAVLPDKGVEEVMAAADQMFRDRGYAVSESNATADAGRIVGQPPRANDAPRVRLETLRVPEGSRVQIFVTPLGNQELSRSLLDGLLRRLAL